MQLFTLICTVFCPCPCVYFSIYMADRLLWWKHIRLKYEYTLNFSFVTHHPYIHPIFITANFVWNFFVLVKKEFKHYR